MNSLEMLAHIAAGLGPLRGKVVFVGGCTVPLYLTDPGAGSVRPTQDVDCVIEAVTRRQFHAFEAELERLGFRHSMEPGAPVCRWKYQGLIADIMPAAGDVLGFRNIWYPEGCANSRSVDLPDGAAIRIFTLPYFLASKIEAFLARGHGDFLTSPDMEDIISVLDGCETAAEDLGAAPQAVRRYLAGKFREFLADERFMESLEGNLRPAAGGAGRVERMRRLLASL